MTIGTETDLHDDGSRFIPGTVEGHGKEGLSTALGVGRPDNNNNKKWLSRSFKGVTYGLKIYIYIYDDSVLRSQPPLLSRSLGRLPLPAAFYFRHRPLLLGPCPWKPSPSPVGSKHGH